MNVLPPPELTVLQSVVHHHVTTDCLYSWQKMSVSPIGIIPKPTSQSNYSIDGLCRRVDIMSAKPMNVAYKSTTASRSAFWIQRNFFQEVDYQNRMCL